VSSSCDFSYTSHLALFRRLEWFFSWQLKRKGPLKYRDRVNPSRCFFILYLWSNLTTLPVRSNPSFSSSRAAAGPQSARVLLLKDPMINGANISPMSARNSGRVFRFWFDPQIRRYLSVLVVCRWCICHVSDYDRRSRRRRRFYDGRRYLMPARRRTATKIAKPKPDPGGSTEEKSCLRWIRCYQVRSGQPIIYISH